VVIGAIDCLLMRIVPARCGLRTSVRTAVLGDSATRG